MTMKTIDEIKNCIISKYDTEGLINAYSDAYWEYLTYCETCEKCGWTPELTAEDFEAYVDMLADEFLNEAGDAAASAIDSAGATDWDSYDPTVHDGVAVAAIVAKFGIPAEVDISWDSSPGTIEEVASAAASAALRAMRWTVERSHQA